MGHIGEHLLVLIKQKAVKPGCPWHCKADTFATIRKCRAKTSVESFVPSLQWSPSRFVTRCHQEKIQNFCICHVFGVRKKLYKICVVETSFQFDKWCAPFIYALAWFPTINCTTRPVLFSACNHCELWGINQAQNQGQTKTLCSLGGMDDVGCWEILYTLSPCIFGP